MRLPKYTTGEPLFDFHNLWSLILLVLLRTFVFALHLSVTVPQWPQAFYSWAPCRVFLSRSYSWEFIEHLFVAVQ